MKTEKTLRMLKLLSMLQAQAARARKLQGSGGGGARRSAKKPKAVDPAQAAELKVAFDFFDKDKSGFIDKSELKLVLGSLGTALSEDDLALLYVEMDPSGDGQIDLSEFTSVMAQDPSDKPSARPAPTPTSTTAHRGPNGGPCVVATQRALFATELHTRLHNLRPRGGRAGHLLCP